MSLQLAAGSGGLTEPTHEAHDGAAFGLHFLSIFVFKLLNERLEIPQVNLRIVHEDELFAQGFEAAWFTVV